MPDNDYRAAMRRLHDVYHAPADADLHPSQPDNPTFRDTQPGTDGFMRAHLVGPGQAPERFIERIDSMGAEGIGVVEIVDGRTGRPLKRVHRRVDTD